MFAKVATAVPAIIPLLFKRPSADRVVNLFPDDVTFDVIIKESFTGTGFMKLTVILPVTARLR